MKFNNLFKTWNLEITNSNFYNLLNIYVDDQYPSPLYWHEIYATDFFKSIEDYSGTSLNWKNSIISLGKKEGYVPLIQKLTKSKPNELFVLFSFLNEEGKTEPSTDIFDTFSILENKSKHVFASNDLFLNLLLSWNQQNLQEVLESFYKIKYFQESYELKFHLLGMELVHQAFIISIKVLPTLPEIEFEDSRKKSG